MYIHYKWNSEFWLSEVEFEFLLLLCLSFKAHILKTEAPTAGAGLIIECEFFFLTNYFQFMCSSKVVRLSRTFLYNTSPYYIVCLVGFFHNDHWLEALFLKTSLLYCTESQNVTTWLSCRSSQCLQVPHCFQFCYIPSWSLCGYLQNMKCFIVPFTSCWITVSQHLLFSW